MGQIITLAQRKGGVGKTTLAVAAEFTRRGKDGVLIDSAPQRSACQWAELVNLAFPV